MNLGTWRDIAIVLLAVEAFCGVLIAGAACYFAIRGVLWLKAHLPRITRPALYYVNQTQAVVRRSSRIAIAPFVQGGATAARIRAAWRALGGSARRNSHV